MLLAARARLLRTPAARCASIATRSLNSNVTAASTQLNRLQVAKFRAFSTVDGPKDDDGEVKEELSLEDDDDQNQPNDSEMSPLERLMQHAQQFQLEAEMDDNDGDQGDDATPERSESDDMFANEWNAINDSAKSKSNSGSSGVFKRNTFRRRGNSDRHWKLGRRAEGHVIGKDTDEIDYDAELENVWDDEQLKQRKFHQALRREEDKDHICTNCGERGHRARNCLIPRICSNCGTLGHTARQCRYRRNPDSVDEFLLEEEAFQQKRKKNQKLRKKAAKAANNPSMPRLKELPTSDLNKRNESLRQELDAELDAYADMLEERDRKRKTD
ncbi:Zinc knuckle [Phytophthora infestans]|uniref:Zinc knuckle n=1 Tax=Phytophthora infestans TaxID=4787 RepID=A0A833TDW3_PHYIN|nr:Zinc knuckle [Phytophthora infestans]KAF4132673.1 Zinc knuckle [Phytophthora infestans]